MDEKLNERDIHKHLVKQVKRMRGKVRRVKWIGRRNAPDVLVMIPGHVPFFLEEKRPGKEPTRAQAKEIDELNNAGLRARWANSTDMIDRIIEGAYR